MTIDPYSTLGELGALLRARAITSLALTRLYLARLEKHGAELGAVVTIMREHAERRARLADSELAAGTDRGSLHGIPYGVKDLLATREAKTTWGAEPYREQQFDFDATVVERLDAAGAVLCAKLAMVELAGGFGYNQADASFTGPGRSPWNLEFWSGGSSSGPGAAVAAALVPFAIGSETSGSILTPAAFSGVTGLRPTYGVVSRHGAMALSWTLDKVGPMCRSAEDCGIVLRAIAGRDERDPTTVGEALDWNAAVHAPLKIATIKGTVEKVQPAVRENFAATLALLRDRGDAIEEIDYPDFPYGPTVSTIIDAEGASAFEDLLHSGRAKLLRVPQDQIGGYEAAATLAIDYLRAMRVRGKIRKALLELLQRYDAIAAPTRATVAYPIDKRFDEAYPGVSGGPSLIGSMNLAGAPAIALPNGYGENRLPTSVQFVAAPLREPLLVGLGAWLQQRTDFHRRQPPRFGA